MAAGAASAGGITVVRQEDGLITTQIDGELIAMSVEAGACYGLNAVGTRIWELLAEPGSIDSVCRQLLAEFNVEEDVCRKDVLELLDRLRARGLVTVRAE